MLVLLIISFSLIVMNTSQGAFVRDILLQEIAKVGSFDS
jgi:hypothetical protein